MGPNNNGRMRIKLEEGEGNAHLLLNLYFSDGQKNRYITLFKVKAYAGKWNLIT